MKPKQNFDVFPGTATWHALRTINTPVVDPQNKLKAHRSPKVTDGSEAQVSVEHESSETFEKKQFDGKIVGKCEFNNSVNSLFKLQSQISLTLFYILIYFTKMERLRISLMSTEVQIQSSYEIKIWSQLCIQ